MSKSKLWTPEAKQIFNQHAGKISDEELGQLLGIPAKFVKGRRNAFKIKMDSYKRLPNEIHEWVLANYRGYTTKELNKRLQEAFPQYKINKHTAECILDRAGILRTEEEKEAIRKRLREEGFYANAAEKRAAPRRKNIGQVSYRLYHGKVRLVIKVLGGNYKPYDNWLWRQHYGKNVPNGYHLELIDKDKPIAIENLHLVRNKQPKEVPIGGVTSWLHEGKEREWIKLGDNQWQLYNAYLWNKHHGPVPMGKFVRKIDPSKPTTIENLELYNHVHLANDVNNLAEWFIVQTLGRGKDQAFKDTLKNRPDMILEQRLLLELFREIKNYINTNGNSPDTPMEGAPAKDGE